MNPIRIASLATAGALLTLPLLAGTAAAQRTRDNKTVNSAYDRINLELSGQVNRMLSVVNDGEETELFHVDNDNSSTRFRLVGRGNVNKDFSLGSTIEVQMESNSSAEVSQDNERGLGGTSFTERKLEVWLDSKGLGRLTLGQGDTASNGTSEVDLSGTTVVAYSGIADLAGGMQFRDNAGALSGITIGDVWSNLDGQSRDDRVRYDTPNMGGAVVSASLIANGGWDVAGRYGIEGDGVRLAAAVAYSEPENGSDVDYRINGSMSILHADTGFSVTGGSGMDSLESGNRDPFFWYVKLGWQLSQLTGLGAVAFSIDFGSADEIEAADDEFITAGAFVVQQIGGYGAEIYSGVRYHDLDRGAAGTDEVIVSVFGVRIKF